MAINMRAGLRLSISAVVIICALLSWALLTAPNSPVALLRVVDAAGKPIAGAVIKPEGMRTKSGPYQSGWYSWMPERNHVPNPSVTTDHDGFAKVPYPKYVFERIETGTLCLGVSHSNFVSARPECIVATALPAGAPLRDRINEIIGRIQHQALIAHADPIVLQRGAILRISIKPNPTLKDGKLFAQVSGASDYETNFWDRPEPGTLFTRRLANGLRYVRAFALDASGSVWFSDTTNITGVIGQTNNLEMEPRPGVTLRGKLDATVPRPIINGRLIAHVWPHGITPSSYPPQWHAWARIRDDGTFEIPSLPSGDLEVIAICQGFINTNGPGKTSMHYPQVHQLGTNDLDIVVGMEPTAVLQVRVNDDKGKPLKDAGVFAWPNARYGEWSAVILAGDCYNMADSYLGKDMSKVWWKPVPDFNGTTDNSGVAILSNLPVATAQIGVEHTNFVLPAISNSFGQRREVDIKLLAGQTNYISVQLERRDASPIRHY